MIECNSSIPDWSLDQKTLKKRLGVLFFAGHFFDHVPDFSDESWKRVTVDVTSDSHPWFRDATASWQRYNWDCRKARPLFVDGKYGHVTARSVLIRTCRRNDRFPREASQPRWSTKDLSIYWDGSSLGALNQSLCMSAMKFIGTACGVVGRAGLGSFANLRETATNLGGPGGVLAQHWLPNNNEPSSQTLNGQYDTSDVNLYEDRDAAHTVLTHELQHGIGLPHSPNEEDIIYSMYTKPKFKFGEWETREMQQRYGEGTGDGGGGGDGTKPEIATIRIQMDNGDVYLDELRDFRKV